MPSYHSIYNVKDYGALGNGSADDTAAFEAALADMTSGLAPGLAAGILFVPAGTYWISRTLHFHHSLIVQGAGAHNNASVLFYYGPLSEGIHPSIAGMVFESSAGWSVLRDIALRGWIANPGSQQSDDDRLLEHNLSGIIARCTITIENCDISSFAHDGIHINSIETNANSWSIQRTWVRSNERHGLFVGGGGDNNAGLCTGLTATANKRFGVYESSFLGNTYVGCHAEGNAGGSYIATSGDARNVFVGCYSEGDQYCAIRYPNMILGGHLASALHDKLDILPGMGYPTVLSNEGYLFRVNGSMGTNIKTLTYPSERDVYLQLNPEDSVVLIKGGEAYVHITLPPIDGSTQNLLKNPFGRPYLIKNIGPGKLYIRAHNPVQKIDGNEEFELLGQYNYVELVSDYEQWYVIGKR